MKCLNWSYNMTTAKRKNTSNKIGSTFEGKLIKVFDKYRKTK